MALVNLFDRKNTVLWLILFINIALNFGSCDSEEIICSLKNSSDCYPRIFKPTEDWQTIKEGQEIPPGLHVRLNIDTLEKEAKFIDPMENQQDNTNSALVIGESKEQGNMEALQQENIEALQKKKGGKKPKVSQEDLQSFKNCAENIKYHSESSSKKELTNSLDGLAELSHDVEIGALIIKDGMLFDKLLLLASKDGSNDGMYASRIYGIIAASLRNNEGAIANYLSKMSPETDKRLFENLTSRIPNITKNRILGVVLALIIDESYRKQYFIPLSSLGLDTLIEVFPTLDDSSQTRVINILNDLGLTGHSSEKGAPVAFSFFLQDFLRENQCASSAQFKTYYEMLCRLHSDDKSVKASKEFMQWLSDEAMNRRKGKRDSKSVDRSFDDYIIETRHTVFGNPNALRKSMADEL